MKFIAETRNDNTLICTKRQFLKLFAEKEHEYLYGQYILPKNLIGEAYDNFRAAVLVADAAFSILTNDYKLDVDTASQVLPDCLAVKVQL